MIFLVIASSLVCVARSQQHPSAFGDLEKSGAVPYSVAPLHYVKIGSRLEGDYRFGYDTGKGPMGQSFREEVRLADGTVKGSYGVIDELGHKRVFHYSAGKGGLISAQDTNKLSSLLPVRQRQPKFLAEENYSTLSKQFPVFKPTNYLQARAVSPLFTPMHAKHTDNRLPVAVKDVKPVAPFYRLPNWTGRDSLYRISSPMPSEKASVTAVQSPLQPVVIAGPSYRTSTVPTPEQKFSAASVPASAQKVSSTAFPILAQKVSEASVPAPSQKVSSTAVPTPTQKISATTVQAPPVKPAVPLYKTFVTQKAFSIQSPLQPVKVTVPLNRASVSPKASSTRVRSGEIRQGDEDKSIAALTEMYNSQTRQRVTKQPSPPAKLQMKHTIEKKQEYDAKMEDDYYDSAPAFIDFERLSYNIGSDKSSASV